MRGKGKKFEPGAKPGPGRPPLPAWVKETKAMNQEAFNKALGDICRFSTEHVRVIAEDETLPIKSSIMASWLLAARVDNIARSTLLERLYGKVKDSIDLNITGQLQKVSDEDLMTLIKTQAIPLIDGSDDAN